VLFDQIFGAGDGTGAAQECQTQGHDGLDSAQRRVVMGIEVPVTISTPSCLCHGPGFDAFDLYDQFRDRD
jgi:hypothetical protein